jgi:hypothetical protein
VTLPCSYDFEAECIIITAYFAFRHSVLLGCSAARPCIYAILRPHLGK